MNAANSLRAEMLRAAVSMIGTDQIAWPLTVQLVCPCGVAVQHFTEEQWRALTEDDDTTDAQADSPGSVDDCERPLSEREEDALEAAADRQWRSSMDLAARAGYEYDGTWRGSVKVLIDRALLERQRGTKRLRRTLKEWTRATDSESDD